MLRYTKCIAPLKCHHRYRHCYDYWFVAKPMLMSQHCTEMLSESVLQVTRQMHMSQHFILNIQRVVEVTKPKH